MSAKYCRPQWRNFDYSLDGSMPPKFPWFSAEIGYGQPRKRKRMESWSKRQMGAEVMRANSSIQPGLSEDNLTLDNSPWIRINDVPTTVWENGDLGESTLQPEDCLDGLLSSQLSTDSGYCSSKDGEYDSRGNSIALSIENSPSPPSSIDNKVEDFQSTLASKISSSVPQYPRNLEIDQWSQSYDSEEEHHGSNFPISPDFDSYFEQLLDPQLNGSPEEESWPDGLTPDSLLDISFNLLRPFKRSLASGHSENSTQKSGTNSFFHSNMRSVLGCVGQSISPTYEYQSFDIFGDQSKQSGFCPFPEIAWPSFTPENTEYTSTLVRDNHSRGRTVQNRRLIESCLGKTKFRCDDIPAKFKACCSGGKIASDCTSCGAQPKRLERCKQCLGAGQMWKRCRRCCFENKETQSIIPRPESDNHDSNDNVLGHQDVLGSHAEEVSSTIKSPAAKLSQDSWSEGLTVEGNTTALEEESRSPTRISELNTPSANPNMPYGDADLEFRVFSVLGSDPGLARSVVCRLKDQSAFVSPLFCDADEGLILGDSSWHNSPVYERGSSRSPSATSSASQAKSSSTSSGMTPATSITSRKSGDEKNGDDEESPSRDRPRKRQKVATSKQHKTTGRRRLRCHFHAKCPITHNQKACVMSGWLSIHNLRGHYSSHHTKIRCNKCFGKFERKTEKNVHQRSCSVNAPPPSFEVIDCDKLDELEECLGIFRSWQLESEEDQTMRLWILKYIPELSNSSNDEIVNARELAKWYRIWQILYPSLQSPVPSPFHDESMSPANLKSERILAVFQSLAEAKFEQAQLPPTELSEQLDYYKDMLRKVFSMMQSSPGSSPSSSFGSSTQSESHLAATPACTMTNAAPTTSQTPMASQFQNLGPTPAATTSTMSSITTDTAGPSALSPYAIETSGAVGQSPVLSKSQSRQLSLGNAPSPAQVFSSATTERVSTGPLEADPLIPTTSLSRIEGISMGPPPPKNVCNAQASCYPSSPLDFSHRILPSEFVAGDTKFLSFEENQRNSAWKPWTGNEITGEREFFCQVCSSSGLVDLGEGAQQCFSCNPSYSMHA